jgi:hypothetical protein
MEMRQELSAVAISALLALGGCAERSQLGSDLHAAGDACRQQNFKDKTSLDECLTAHERPLWAKEEPATLDVYDRFAQQRLDLARQYDSGAITRTQYSDKLDQLKSDIRHELRRRHEETAAAR